MVDTYENALRAARELWGEEGAEMIHQEILERSRPHPDRFPGERDYRPGAADENWSPESVSGGFS